MGSDWLEANVSVAQIRIIWSFRRKPNAVKPAGLRPPGVCRTRTSSTPACSA